MADICSVRRNPPERGLSLNSQSCCEFRSQHPYLDENPRKIKDALFVDDLGVPQCVNERAIGLHLPAGGWESEEVAVMGAGNARDESDAVTIDEQVSFM